ncbi:MAG: ATP-binding protein, partial [Rivularia sp. (in: cyanobacteria)]
KKSPNIQNGLEEKIVEYQKKDNELRTSLSLLNSTLDSTANGILAINIEGEILYYNQKFIDIWDLPADVKISRNCSEAKAPFESQVQIWEFPTVSDSETYILLELKDDKQAESELRQALEQARRLSELRQRFVSMLCHQFRTPLNVVSFSSDLLRRNIHQWSKEKNHSYLDLIQDAVEQISELLDEILLFGKAEADRLKCEPRELDLNQFCQGIIAQIYLAEGKQNAINFISGGECSTKNVDPKLLQHILTNLLSNAIKYSVGSNAVDLKLICGDNHVIFQIKDKGIGIPAVDREQIFEPFYRGTNIDNIPGTGLGLSIVKTLADLHGCEISLSSKVGTGTTFILKVPSTNN